MSSEPKTVKLTVDPQKVDYQSGYRYVLKRFKNKTKRQSPIKMVALWIGFFLFCLMMFQLQSRFNILNGNPEIMLVLLIVAILIGTFFLVKNAQKSTFDSLRDAPIRQSVAEYSFSPKGMKVQADGSSFEMEWRHAVDVIETPEEVLILISDTECHNIGPNIFETEEEKSAFVAQIRDWIEKA